MKTIFQIIFGTVASLFFATSCQRNSLDETFVVKEDKAAAIAGQAAVLANRGPAQGACNPDAYTITLESRTQINGNWEWVWSILNSNPGNGNNGTAQDLSNWGMQFGSCVDWTSVVGAAYSENGMNWTSFAPSYEVNPSQGCLTGPVLKFDFGTSGGAKSYFRLIVNQEYGESLALGYYKSGGNTSCCTFSFTGIGCSGTIEMEIVE